MSIGTFICDALRDLVPSVQLKKCEKHSWGSVTFSSVAGFSLNFTKSSTPLWLFSCFLNCINGTKSRKASHITKQYDIASLTSSAPGFLRIFSVVKASVELNACLTCQFLFFHNVRRCLYWISILKWWKKYYHTDINLQSNSSWFYVFRGYRKRPVTWIGY